MATVTSAQELSAVDSALINTNACEINVAHHCNLSCRGCSHLSPVWSKEFVNPESLRVDLGIMAKFYHSRVLRLLGGEPLLHPNILDVIAAARDSRMSDHVLVATNGVLLWKMPDEFWKAVDIVDVSVYPGKEMTSKQLRTCQQKARKFKTNLDFCIRNEFRESYSEVGTDDRKLIKRIYDTCLIIHRLHCHNIEQGYFYKCPQAVFLPKMLDGRFPSPHLDGIKIVDSPEFGAELRAYLDSSYPLASCKHCLGSVGKKFAHEQLRRSEWRQPQQAKLDDLVDHDLLAALERDLDNPEGQVADGRYFVMSNKQMLKYLKARYGYREALKFLFDLARGRQAEAADNRVN